MVGSVEIVCSKLKLDALTKKPDCHTHIKRQGESRTGRKMVKVLAPVQQRSKLS